MNARRHLFIPSVVSTPVRLFAYLGLAFTAAVLALSGSQSAQASCACLCDATGAAIYACTDVDEARDADNGCPPNAAELGANLCPHVADVAPVMYSGDPPEGSGDCMSSAVFDPAGEDFRQVVICRPEPL